MTEPAGMVVKKPDIEKPGEEKVVAPPLQFQQRFAGIVSTAVGRANAELAGNFEKIARKYEVACNNIASKGRKKGESDGALLKRIYSEVPGIFGGINYSYNQGGRNGIWQTPEDKEAIKKSIAKAVSDAGKLLAENKQLNKDFGTIAGRTQDNVVVVPFYGLDAESAKLIMPLLVKALNGSAAEAGYGMLKFELSGESSIKVTYTIGETKYEANEGRVSAFTGKPFKAAPKTE